MSDRCECCGVKYSGVAYVGREDDVEKMDQNLKWCSTISRMNSSGRICLWCSTKLPGGIVDVVLGSCSEHMGYNHFNVRGYPQLAKRIKSIQPVDVKFEVIDVVSGCPRCGAAMGETESIIPFSGGKKEIVSKCFRCGYC
jgi:hypothetical protein